MPKAQAKKSKHIFLLLRIAVVAGGIIWGVLWLSKEQRWDNLANIFLRMNLWIFAFVVGVFTIGQIITALRWWLLLRSQSIFIGFWAAVRLYFLGWFYNNFMPGAVGGDLLRAWYVTKHTDKKFEAVLSVFVDRVVIGLSGTLIIAVFCYLFFMRGQLSAITFSGRSGFLRSVAEYRGVFLWMILAVVIVFLGLLLYRPSRATLRKGWAYLRVCGVRIIEKFRDAVIIYCTKPLTILAALAMTICLQVMIITSFWFLGRSLGINVSAKYYYLIFALSWVLGAVPVSIGGAVVVESLLAYLFIQLAGVEAETALALALCQRAVWMLASLPGAVIHLVGAHLPKDFFIDYDKSTN